MTVGYGLSNEMFDTQRINFHAFEGNKNGSPKEHKFRVLPAYAPGKLFFKVGLHWGYKTPDGKTKALTCALEAHGSCPICERIEALKGQLENINAALTTEYDPQARASLEEQKRQIEEYVGEHRRKPMYLWNIVTETGDQKVLQLSWNGHDPLFEKIKFIFTQKKLDITNLQANYLMYCNRSGLKAKTRYVYEMLEGTEKQMTDVASLIDLSKVYLPRSLEYLTQVVQTEMIPPDKQDPNDRSFTSQPESNMEQVPVTQPGQTAPTQQTNAPAYTQPHVGNASAPAATLAQTQSTVPNAGATSAPTASHSNPQPQLNLTEEQDKNVAEMMAALNS